jgi:hypothetical protein
MQRLDKHVPFARQQILNNATAGPQQWKVCFYQVRAARGSSALKTVKRGPKSVKLKNLHC